MKTPRSRCGDKESEIAAELLLGKYVLLSRIRDLKMQDLDGALKYANRFLKRTENVNSPQYHRLRHLALLEVARLTKFDMDIARSLLLEVLDLIKDHVPQKRVLGVRALVYALLAHTKVARQDEEGMRHYLKLWVELLEPRLLPNGRGGVYVDSPRMETRTVGLPMWGPLNVDMSLQTVLLIQPRHPILEKLNYGGAARESLVEKFEANTEYFLNLAKYESDE